MLKILHLSKFSIFTPGGIEKFLHDLTEYQVENGCKVKIVCFGDKNEIENVNNIEQIKIKSNFQISYAPISIYYCNKIERIIRDFNPNIIHLHMPNSMPLFCNLKKNNSKIVIHWHSDVFFTKNKFSLTLLYNFYKIFEKKLLKKSDAIICTSKEYFLFSRPLKSFSNKVFIVPLGIKEASVKENEIKYGDFILSVGRFSYYKGFKYLINAMELLDDRVRLILVGDGEDFKNIQQLIRKKKLENKVILTGKVSDEEKMRLLKECRLFILPSIERTEAFGISLLEAMQYRKPLITTNIKGSGVNFVNLHNVTGLVVPVKDSQSLANAIKQLFYNLDLCRKFGENSYNRYIENFTIKKCGEKIFKIYNNLNCLN